MSSELLRNFCIIAHIDHGKSTLADRLLERTGALSQREMTEQVLDQMDLERERGITIKAKAVRLDYTAPDSKKYVLNLIDTPGHVDFNYEVSRALAACEGAVLVIDASQGIEAQTLANLYLALDHNLEIIPVINKIDLPSAEPERVRKELEDVTGLPGDEAILASAKTGQGVDEILDAIVKRIPPPPGDSAAPLRALIFDSHYDSYKGVIAYIRVVEGKVAVGDRIRMMSTGKEFEVAELAWFRPALVATRTLEAGEVGCVMASMKNVADSRVGDTITSAANPAAGPLPGYRPATPMVFCGLYPIETDDYGMLKDALEKLQLNDASLLVEPGTSAALGFGFRCGFLGLLHMEIIQERLEREYGLNLIATAPSVSYHVLLTDGEVMIVDNPALLPPPERIEEIEEPFVAATIIVPPEFVGSVMEVCREKRGVFTNMEYLGTSRVRLQYDMPLGEILLDFFDKLKSRTKGYASLDYSYLGHRVSDLVKLDILIAGKPIDAFSSIVHRERAQARGRLLTEKLRSMIPRQLFEVALQAAIGGRIVARETIKPLRKDVLAKCYGGDITRKRKLLEKQKEGKKRMKSLGNVEIPQEAFMAVLRIKE